MISAFVVLLRLFVLSQAIYKTDKKYILSERTDTAKIINPIKNKKNR